MSKQSERIPPIVRRAIMAELENNIHRVDNNTCRYKNGVSDNSIANRYAVGLWTVQNLRRQFFGHLEGDVTLKGTHSPMANAWRRIMALEEDVQSLKEEVTKLKQ